MFGRPAHLFVDREVVSKLYRPACLGGTPCKPVQDSLAIFSKPCVFQMFQNFGRSADAMNAEDIITLLGTGVQDAGKKPLLRLKTVIKVRAGIKSYLTHVTCGREIVLE